MNIVFLTIVEGKEVTQTCRIMCALCLANNLIVSTWHCTGYLANDSRILPKLQIKTVCRLQNKFISGQLFYRQLLTATTVDYIPNGTFTEWALVADAQCYEHKYSSTSIYMSLHNYTQLLQVIMDSISIKFRVTEYDICSRLAFIIAHETHNNLTTFAGFKPECRSVCAFNQDTLSAQHQHPKNFQWRQQHGEVASGTSHTISE